MGYYQGSCVSITDCNSRMTSTTISASAGSSNFTTGLITTAPLEISKCSNVTSNGSDSGSTCVLQNAYCSLQGSGHALDGLRDVCVLWDKSCCGNSALAPQSYWKENLWTITSNDCYFDYSLDCTKSNPAGRMSAFEEFKNWMRGPQCLASSPLIAGDPVRICGPFSSCSEPDIELRDLFQEHSLPLCSLIYFMSWSHFLKERYILTLNHVQNDAMVYQGDEFLNATCCGGNCQIVADKVDVYYWPDPLADTSCSSIVGSEVSYIADGATTNSWAMSIGVVLS